MGEDKPTLRIPEAVVRKFSGHENDEKDGFSRMGKEHNKNKNNAMKLAAWCVQIVIL